MNRYLFVLALVLAGVGHAAPAAMPDMTEARKAAVFTFYFENDCFGKTDRHYTNGSKFSWLSADYSSWKARNDEAGDIGERLPLVDAAGTQKNFGFAIGQAMYTPQDKDLVVPDPKDRPYAGWSYLELSFLSKSEIHLDTLSVAVGIVGPWAYAKQTQHEIHRILGSHQAMGWHYQLKNEPGLNVVYERKWRIFARSVAEIIDFDAISHAGVSLGNVQTYANGGGTLRMGYQLPSDFGVQLIRPGGAGNSPLDDLDPRVALNRNFSLFAFGAVDGRAIARDIFLDGNTFRDSPSVDKEYFVADFSCGLGLIAGRWQLTYTKVLRTREFKSQIEPHNDFGSVTLSVAF